MTRQTARATYYDSFIRTVSERIAKAREDAVRRAEESEHAVGPTASGGDPRITTAVALREKALEVTDYYGSASSARGTWGGSRPRVLGLSESAREAGHRDAHRVRLADDGQIGGPSRALGA